jgi:4-amino-4-deoxy-L-arabinose transferase-like glycosyltransferase
MRRQHILGLALAVVLASTLITPFARELFVGDETKYSMVVREMRATGAFFLPTLLGEPFTHKPPLHFWMIDVLTVPLGVYSIWAFVLPSLIAYAALLWIVYAMGGELFEGRRSTMAAFICGTSLMVWGSAQTARMDVSFTALLAVAAWLMFRFFQRDDFRALFFAGIALGVATLVKGPMAPVIAIVLFAIEWWRRKSAPRGNYAWAILVMILIPLMWFVPAMIIGGSSYTQDVLQKQMAERAVSAWVHKSPPWFYLAHAPAYLAPWFLLILVAVIAVYRRAEASAGAKYCVSWLVAVLLPYSIISSKLDVYMMALIPPVALLAASFVERAGADRWTRWGLAANAVELVLLVAIGAAGLLISPNLIKGPESVYLQTASVRMLFVVLASAAVAAIAVVGLTRSLAVSTIAVGLVPLAAFAYAGFALMPVVNEIASTRPLVRELVRQQVPGNRIALYAAPHLWTHDMPLDLERVHYVSTKDFTNPAFRPTLIVTSRSHAGEIAGVLAGYRLTSSVRMIGKWTDVYRR